jgi:ribosomal-protein-alanine N-acetyltransferase
MSEVTGPTREREPAPTAEVRLRLMDERDLEAVLALERACFADPWSRESFLAEIEDSPQIRWPLVAVGEELAGYVVAWFVEDEAHLANLAIAPGYRRRGLASRLVRAVLAEARRRGSRWIQLEVRVTNTAALALYQGLGFRSVGRRHQYYADTREDAWIMQFDLDPSGTA